MVSSAAAQGLEYDSTSPSAECPSPLFTCIGPGIGGPSGTPPSGTPPWPQFIIVEPQLKQKGYYGLGTEGEITLVPGSPPLTEKIIETLNDRRQKISREEMYLFYEGIERNGKKYEYIIVPGSSLLE